ncbi:MAG: hypothetical protein PHI34_03560 [Acidobacteriota bacterium]|nr:hypothetical protein [Acidobacteriota bacterium]
MNEYSARRRFVPAAAATLILLGTTAVSFPQVIENPKRPPSPNAGRIVPLKEVARITDEKGKFFFVQPIAVFTGRDGSVYVQEYKQLLKFDPQGRFVKNLLKRGSGPGELNDNLTDVLILEKEIILWSSNSLKLIRINLDGRLIADKTSQVPLGSLLGTFGGRYFFLKREIGERPKSGISGIFENDYRLVTFNERGEIVPTPVLMPCTSSLHFRPGSVSSGTISRPMPLAADDRSVFLFHSPEYLIKLLDLETGEIVRSFKREYDRVKYTVKTPPGYPAELVPKFHNDLCRLLWRNDRLWAVTSTFDPKKGILVDVFSREGRYLDNFYLPLFKVRRNNPQIYAPMAIHGDFLYLLEADEDDLISLIKYEIGGN